MYFAITFIYCSILIDPIIVWQSPSVVKITVWKDVVTLYCLCSEHGQCDYQWTKLGETSGHNFPSSPIIYVSNGGVYRCIVKTAVKTITGRIIRVYANIGQPNNSVN